MKRRNTLSWLVLLVLASHAQAQSQGGEGFRTVAPFPSGGPVDMLSRILADGLKRKQATLW